MRPENLKEYDYIRRELAEVKSCTTQYIGFVLGGSGLALVALTFAGNRPVGPLALFYTPLALSLILLLVLFVLYYKFNSHNRFAGYSYALSAEQWADQPHRQDDMVIWEICIRAINAVADRPELLLAGLSRVERTDQTAELAELLLQYARRRGKGPSGYWWRGFKILGRFFMCKLRTPPSWSYPLWVTMPFAVLDVILVSVSIYIGAELAIAEWPRITNGLHVERQGVRILPYEIYVAGAAFLAVVAFKIRMWVYLLSKLFHLLEGDATVIAFERRFEAVRHIVLQRYDIRPSYVDRGIS